MRYGYRCSSCGEEEEIDLTVANRDMYVGFCPACHRHTYTRTIHAPLFKLGRNGKVGWASTGYADNVVGNTQEFKDNGTYTKEED